MAEKFRRTGSVHDDVEAMKTTPRSARTPGIIEKPRERVSSDPGIPTRDLARDLDISQRSAHRILRKDLGFTLYNIQTFQALGDRDQQKRHDFASETCQAIDEKKLNPHKIMFTDEAHFHLDGYVIKQNYRIQGTEKPSIRTEPLHPKRVTSFAGISSKGSVGPIFVPSPVKSMRRFCTRRYLKRRKEVWSTILPGSRMVLRHIGFHIIWIILQTLRWTSHCQVLSKAIQQRN